MIKVGLVESIEFIDCQLNKFQPNNATIIPNLFKTYILLVKND